MEDVKEEVKPVEEVAEPVEKKETKEDVKEKTFTEEEVNALIAKETSKYADLESKFTKVAEEHKALAEQLKEMETLKADNLKNAIILDMVKSGLEEDLYDLVSAADLPTAKSKIAKLVALNKKKVIEDSYKPTEHKTDADEYNLAEQKKDVEGMLKSRFKNLFK